MPSSGGRGAAGIIIPVIVALALGGGAGYGGARFAGKDNTADIAQRDQLIAELKSEISDAKFKGESSSTDKKQMQDEIAGLNAEIKTLQAKVKTFQKGSSTASGMANQLADVEDALVAARARVKELQTSLTDKTKQYEQLKSSANNSIAAVDADRKELQSALADAQRKLTTVVPALEDEIASLKERLSDRHRELDRDTEAKLDQLTTENRRLREQLRNAGGEDAGGRESELQASLDRAQSQIARAKADMDKLRADNDRLLKAQASLENQIAKLKSATPDKSKPKPADDTVGGDDNSGLTPRKERTVRTAVDAMPGAERLDDAKREVLVDSLVKGECVTTALKSSFGSVPKASLRDLLRELGGNC